MIASRAYHYVAPAPRSPSPGKRRKNSPSRAGNSPPLSRDKHSSDRIAAPQKLNAVLAATPSKPVVIPTRTRSSKGPRATSERGSESLETDSWGHDARAIPPSMAALLAITAIPQSKSPGHRKKGMRRRTAAECMTADDFRQSVSSSSPKSWTILQSSPEEYEDNDDSRTEKSVGSETDASSLRSIDAVVASSFRSLSSDSMPSLEIDIETESAQSISPPASAYKAKLRTRRERMPSPATTTSSDIEHPLATTSYPESPQTSPPLTPVAEERPSGTFFSPSTATSTTSFKSNLTASLKMLKSAAKVLTSPTRLHDPAALTIATSTSSSPNQVSTSSSGYSGRDGFSVSGNIDALPLHLSVQLPGPPPRMSIQLQSCQTSPLTTPTASAPPIFLASTDPPLDIYEKNPLQREPRENSDFLRVVVLEMNMRRAGKLSGEGRARIWLGARQEVTLNVAGRVTAGIADGGEGHGAVVLDGEFGEAQEVETELEHPHHHHPPSKNELRTRRPVAGRAQRVPQRWMPMVPG